MHVKGIYIYWPLVARTEWSSSSVPRAKSSFRSRCIWISLDVTIQPNGLIIILGKDLSTTEAQRQRHGDEASKSMFLGLKDGNVNRAELTDDAVR